MQEVGFRLMPSSAGVSRMVCKLVRHGWWMLHGPVVADFITVRPNSIIAGCPGTANFHTDSGPKNFALVVHQLFNEEEQISGAPGSRAVCCP